MALETWEMSAPECSCLIIFTSRASIDYCPLHEAAAQMYRWLDLAADALEMLDTTCAEFGDEKMCGECAGCGGQIAAREARSVLGAARGETERVR